MPTSHRIAALAAAVACAVLMTGCVSDAPAPKPSPEPSATPVFASEEEALAAATEAYEAYQTTSDQILAESGGDPTRIDAVAVSSARTESYAAFDAFARGQYRSVGKTSFSKLTLQQYVANATQDEEVVVAYTCVDVSGVDVMDAGGMSIVNPNRPGAQAFQVGFSADANSSLVVSSNEARDGEGICSVD